MTIAEGKIDQELKLNRIAGPFSHPPFAHFKISPLALRPKKDSSKFRLLHNLSYPYDHSSVNFNIPYEYSHVNYDSITNAIKIIQQNPSCYLAKSDISDAFRLIPLHPSQFHLTGFQFNGQFYFDRCLPQGCSSSCFIFEKFSDSLRWAMVNLYNTSHIVKVLDDFLFINDSYSLTKIDLDNFTDLCQYLKVPLAHHKTEGPSQCLTFLGIELDTKSMMARLPLDKLKAYSDNVTEMLSRNRCTLRELKSILGKLQFSTSVLATGKSFLRRMYDATIGVANPNHFIRITKPIKEDLLTWKKFLSEYNGITLISVAEKFDLKSLHMYTDSSNSGFGGTFMRKYISGYFPNSWKDYSIQFLELYPIFLMLHLVSSELINKRIIFHCDNQAIVNIINKQSSKCTLIMKLMRPMVLLMLQNNITFTAVHIPGKSNIVSDALSRSQATTEMLSELEWNSLLYPSQHTCYHKT